MISHIISPSLLVAAEQTSSEAPNSKPGTLTPTPPKKGVAITSKAQIAGESHTSAAHGPQNPGSASFWGVGALGSRSLGPFVSGCRSSGLRRADWAFREFLVLGL